MNAPLKIFVIYAREDLVFKNNLLNAFIPLERTGRVKVFHDALIKPGERWEDIILDNLRTAHIIVPLVSPDFFASDFIRDVEFQKAKERYQKGEITIMPIILKHCGWKYDPDISTLQVLPRDGKPVVTWTYHEEAWEQVLDAVHEVTEREKAAAQRKQEEAEAKKRRDEAEPFAELGRDAADPIDKIVYYSKAIEIDLDYAVAYNNRGVAKLDLKQYDKAIKDFDKAILLDARFAAAYNNRAFAKGMLGQNSEAIQDYDEAISLAPEFSTAYCSRGTAKNNLKQYAEAIKDYDEAIRLNPEYTIAYNNRGSSKNDLKQYAEAIRDYDQAIRLNPEYAMAYNNRGVAKENLNRLEEAQKDYQKALSLDPNLEIAKNNLKNLEAQMK